MISNESSTTFAAPGPNFSLCTAIDADIEVNTQISLSDRPVFPSDN